MEKTRHYFDCDYEDIPKGYITPESLLNKNDTNENSTNEQLRLDIETTPPSDEILSLADKFDLTDLGRQIFLEIDTCIVDTRKPIVDLFLPDNYSQLTLADWRDWFAVWPRAASERYRVLQNHYYGKIMALYEGKDNAMTVIIEPFRSFAEIERSILHEFLHAIHHQMPPNEKTSLYNDFATLLCYAGPAFHDEAPWRQVSLYELITRSAKANQHIYDSIVDPQLPHQFIEKIRFTHSRQALLPKNTLGKLAIISLFNEAYAYIGSDISSPLERAGIAQYYEPYFVQRESTVADINKRSEVKELDPDHFHRSFNKWYYYGGRSDPDEIIENRHRPEDFSTIRDLIEAKAEYENELSDSSLSDEERDQLNYYINGTITRMINSIQLILKRSSREELRRRKKSLREWGTKAQSI